MIESRELHQKDNENNQKSADMLQRFKEITSEIQKQD